MLFEEALVGIPFQSYRLNGPCANSDKYKVNYNKG